MNWFISDLINIREDLERTPNFTADIHYDYRDIIKQKSIFKITTKLGAINKIDEMLSYIKSDAIFLGSFNISEKYLSYSVMPNGVTVIKGYQIEILNGYLDKINGIKKQKDDPINKYRNIYKDKSGDYFLNENGKPRLLKLKKESLYFLAFDALYSLAPDGGTVTFGNFTGKVKLEVGRKLRGKDDKEKCRIISSYLTDKSNGFLRASKIKDSTFNEKPIIECNLRTGITFNNKK